jgi:crotonobetainyl-CoA:carnitine CoA-transferase CaiB-like acyl-CoA transferase
MSNSGTDASAVPAGPLSGLRVIDWTHVLAGPFAGYQLGLLGAEVIRIERADGDDLVRTKAADPALGALGLGEGFVTQGAGKRSLAVNARDPRARQALCTLIASADVLLENFRPGKLAALGFDPQVLIERHPRLVVCSMTGFGPQSNLRAYDHVVQASSGFMAANADASGRPQRVGFPVIDYAMGQQAVMAVLAALLRRDRRDPPPPPGSPPRRQRGEWLQVSMAGAAISLLAPVYAPTLVSGITPPRSASTAFSGSPLSGSFDAADGVLAVVCNAVDQAQGLMRALREAGCGDGAMADLLQAAQQRDVTAAQALLAAAFRARAVDDWVTRLAAQGVPAAPVMTAAAAAQSAAAHWPAVDLPSSDGTRRVSVPGIGFDSSEPLTVGLGAPPRRGAQTRVLLAEAGLDDATINAMLADGAAWEPVDMPGSGP